MLSFIGNTSGTIWETPDGNYQIHRHKTRGYGELWQAIHYSAPRVIDATELFGTYDECWAFLTNIDDKVRNAERAQWAKEQDRYKVEGGE